MRKRIELTLKIAFAVFAALLVFQVIRVIARTRTVQTLTVPALPTWSGSAGTNNTSGTNVAKGGTNSAPSAKASGSNDLSSGKAGTNGTNAMVTGKASGSNLVALAKGGTNGTNVAVSFSAAKSNVTASVKTPKTGTNDLKSIVASTNASTAKTGTNSSSTNLAAAGDSTGKGTNSSKTASGMKKGPGQMAGIGKKGPDVPPAIKARIDRIVGSEILGLVPHPMPMGLLGIAGEYAFLRSPEGQTGMIKEGAELGSLKLLRVGTNRVLVEHEGQKQELMIYSGFGGESLMPKEEKKPNEPTKKTP
jgi:hypothetical protein